MYRNVLLICTVIVFFSLFASNVGAQHLKEVQNNDIRLLLIYSNHGSKSSPNVKKLDMLLHHFTNNIKLLSDDEVENSDFQSITHVFYYGEEQKELNDSVITGINTFTGPVIVMGENKEQFSIFDDFIENGKVKISSIQKEFDEENLLLNSNYSIHRIIETENMDVLLYGYDHSESYPLLVKKENIYYIAINQLEGTMEYYLAESLHDMLPNDHRKGHMAYLRLEDIHPMTDPEKLLEVGEYLNRRNIPYILVVIPVYITPNTGERVYFSESPKLVEVLDYLQETGGTVIAHGYTHQYRDSETGEGFEFWDVENDQFITEMEPKANIPKILSQEDFANKKDFQQYIHQLKEKEKEYIEHRMESSIHELVSYGLYPYAFEAPHYTMSQQGYSIVGNYFSTILGQIQLSDEKWQIMSAPPYITTASFLNDMVLYPETIGYVDITLQQPFIETYKQLEQTLIVRDSMIGGFYHPYLGLEYLPEFLEAFEKVPDLTWLDLKKTEQHVATSKVSIISDGTGEIEARNELTWLENVKRQVQLSLVEKILWGITVVVLIFVIFFLIFTIQLRIRLKKRLFEERKSLG